LIDQKLSKFIHPANAEMPIIAIFIGMLIFSINLHPTNAEMPIVVTLFGILIFFNDSQFLNA